MSIKNILLASSAALVLSVGAAAAAPATVQSNVNVRSGPGTQYPVVGALRSGETVDVAGCTGSWCEVSFSGGTGYASQNYLAMAGGGGPGYAAVAPGYADPGYVDDDYASNDYYYDDYGPGVGLYVSPGFRHHRHGRWHGGHWPGRPGWNGGNRVGGVGAPPSRMGNVGAGINPGGVGAPASRMGNVGAGFNRGGVGAPTGRLGNFGAGYNRGGGGLQMSAPTGMRMGGGIGAPGGGGGRIGVGGGGGGRIGGGGGGGGARGGVGAPGR